MASRASIRVLDAMAVRVDRPAAAAVLTLPLPAAPQKVSCDVLIVGASTGGTAAAFAAAQGKHTVCLTEETLWIGGQMTAQGVSAFDGNPYIETTGATASFERLRQAIRDDYQKRDRLSALGAGEKFFNPGNCWVSALCFEAPVALAALRRMLSLYAQKGLLRVDLRTKAVKVERHGNRIDSLLAYGLASHRWLEYHARYVLDATDTGELLPLAGVAYSTGAEPRALTGEPHARDGRGDPNDNQSFTYTFVLAHDAGHDHRSTKPAEYEDHRRSQPYTLDVDYGSGKVLTYKMFEKAPNTPGSFWTYRRLIDAGNFIGPDAPREASMVNWPGNDYCGPGLLRDDPDQQAQALKEAKLTSLGLVYWLQNDAPRDDGRGRGYPGLELLSNALGSIDGLSQYPYIRESRRLRAITTIKEQEISSHNQAGARAAPFADSVGIGLYPIDIHSCLKQDFSVATKPFQIPLGALIPQEVENLLAASKDIGTTHITNGAYRLHPVEWAVGEAAGTLADFAIDHRVTPREIDRDRRLTCELQRRLLDRGAPIYWFDDIQPGDAAFASAQLLAAHGIFGPRPDSLHFAPARAVEAGEAFVALQRALESASSAAPADGHRRLTWKDLARASGEAGISLPQNRSRALSVTRAEFAKWLARVYMRRAALSH